MYHVNTSTQPLWQVNKLTVHSPLCIVELCEMQQVCCRYLFTSHLSYFFYKLQNAKTCYW